MPDALPTANDANIVGRRGVTLLQRRIEQEGWLFRRQDDAGTDFGIDAEIELVRKNTVTGRLFKAQIKTRSVEWNGSKASVTVNTTTYHAWKSLPLLTILFLVDPRSEEIYWTPALTHSPSAGASTLSIHFDQANSLRDDIAALEAYLESWFRTRGSAAVVDEVPYFHRIYKDLCDAVDHYDAGGEVFPETEALTRAFYAHTLRLRIDEGLRIDEAPSLTDWYTRNETLWGDRTLAWAVFSELMEYAKPLYEEALEKLRKRVEQAEWNFENQELKRFFEARAGGNNPYHVVYDPRGRDLAFHRAFEDKLKRAGALKYSIANLKPRKA